MVWITFGIASDFLDFLSSFLYALADSLDDLTARQKQDRSGEDDKKCADGCAICFHSFSDRQKGRR